MVLDPRAPFSSPLSISFCGVFLEQPGSPYTPAVTLWAIFSEHLGRLGTSECQDDPKGLQKAPHLQNCQDFWTHFWSHVGAQYYAFSTSSRVCFQGSLPKAFWSSSGPYRNSQWCSGAGNYRGELDVTHFDIDAVTGASKLSFGLRWGSLWELFWLLGDINSRVLKNKGPVPPSTPRPGITAYR